MTRFWDKKLAVPLVAVVLALGFGYGAASTAEWEGMFWAELMSALVLAGLFLLFYLSFVVRKRFLYALTTLVSALYFFFLFFPRDYLYRYVCFAFPLNSFQNLEYLSEAFLGYSLAMGTLRLELTWYYIFSILTAVAVTTGAFLILYHSLQKWWEVRKKPEQLSGWKRVAAKGWPFLFVTLGAVLHVVFAYLAERAKTANSEFAPPVAMALAGAVLAVLIAALCPLAAVIRRQWFEICSTVVTGIYFSIILYANAASLFSNYYYESFIGSNFFAGSLGGVGLKFLLQDHSIPSALPVFPADWQANFFAFLSGLFVLVGLGVLFYRGFRRTFPVKETAAKRHSVLAYWPAFLVCLTMSVSLFITSVDVRGLFHFRIRGLWKQAFILSARELATFALLIILAVIFCYALKKNRPSGYAIVFTSIAVYFLVVLVLNFHFRPIDYVNPQYYNYKGSLVALSLLRWSADHYHIREVVCGVLGLASAVGMFAVSLLRLLRPVAYSNKTPHVSELPAETV